jgi:hypothetical protein
MRFLTIIKRVFSRRSEKRGIFLAKEKSSKVRILRFKSKLWTKRQFLIPFKIKVMTPIKTLLRLIGTKMIEIYLAVKI